MEFDRVVRSKVPQARGVILVALAMHWPSGEMDTERIGLSLGHFESSAPVAASQIRVRQGSCVGARI
jgi:hypothetical protein